MSGRPHLPVRPIWLCRVDAQPWPCGAARLALLAEYAEDRPGLLVYLATLMAEAGEQLAELDSGTPPADLRARFLDWARAR